MIILLLTGTVLPQYERQLIEQFRNCSVDNETSCFCPAGFARRMQQLSENNCYSTYNTISASKLKLHSPCAHCYNLT